MVFATFAIVMDRGRDGAERRYRELLRGVTPLLRKMLRVKYLISNNVTGVTGFSTSTTIAVS